MAKYENKSLMKDWLHAISALRGVVDVRRLRLGESDIHMTYLLFNQSKVLVQSYRWSSFTADVTFKSQRRHSTARLTRPSYIPWLSAELLD